MRINNTKYILILLILCYFNNSLFGEKQGVKSFQAKGEYYYDHYEFEKAIKYYNRALKKDPSDVLLVLKKADAYIKLNLPQQAEENYFIGINNIDSVPEIYYLKYAQSLISNKKFDESKKWLHKYYQYLYDDIRAKDVFSSIENRDGLYKDSVMYIVENVGSINSIQSDIAPVVYNNRLLFASNRPNNVNPFAKHYYDIYITNIAHDSSANVALFNKSINGKYHVGPLSIIDSLVIFNKNMDTDNIEKEVKLNLYQTTIPKTYKDDLFIKQIVIEGFEHSMGHPTINSNGKTMYFVSKTDNGQGLDIYKSISKNGQWQYPENIGSKINTAGDEMFPFLFNDSVLYFSSNGHTGLGGLDIYSVNLNNPNAKVKNIGYPVSSNADDFGIHLLPDGKSGFFSSNREGGMGSDDLYKVRVLEFKVKGSIYDEVEEMAIESAQICLLLSNGKKIEIPQSENGEFEFSILPNDSYTLIIKKENYKAEKILLGKNLTSAQQKELSIGLEPLHEAKISLSPGVKYNIPSGNDSTNHDYKQKLKQITKPSPQNNQSPDKFKILVKQLQFEKDEMYSMLLIKDTVASNIHSQPSKNLLYAGNDTIQMSDSISFSLPISDESVLNLQTDLDFVTNKFDINNTWFEVDTIPLMLSEIIIDTTDYDGYLNNETILDTTSQAINYPKQDVPKPKTEQKIKQYHEITKDPIVERITINFGIDISKIRDEEKIYINNLIVRELNQDTNSYAVIYRYVNQSDSTSYYQQLSKSQANLVKMHLMNNGITESRIKIFTYPPPNPEAKKRLEIIVLDTVDN